MTVELQLVQVLTTDTVAAVVMQVALTTVELASAARATGDLAREADLLEKARQIRLVSSALNKSAW